MDALGERVETKIASWGNSDGVRIPRSIMHRGGFSSGDKVNIFINERGNIEVEYAKTEGEHRRIHPMKGITFNTLFRDYKPKEEPVTDAWPEDMVGAEMDAWAQ